MRRAYRHYGRALRPSSSSSTTAPSDASASTHRSGVRGARPSRHCTRGYYAFGAFGPGVAKGTSLRHDHGSVFISDDFQREVKLLGITSSPSFVREPEGNGIAERFIRTLKEQLLWLKPFRTVEELRQGLLEFRQRYNASWLVQRHGHTAPAAVRAALRSGAQEAA